MGSSDDNPYTTNVLPDCSGVNYDYKKLVENDQTCLYKKRLDPDLRSGDRKSRMGGTDRASKPCVRCSVKSSASSRVDRF
ncbi:hypothetical protein PGT21_012152 [Puccinia graminis f. sp. tritici]|uniref:Uncharacterized protein n=1 Tax=Puccinia graminis f. sp. tritici TaxID=56615 RepID=A0A5B0QF60_PUCGR|nr:hypothetical protein PGT21_012152 [Puccinia graminis f. sp. tritici]